MAVIVNVPAVVHLTTTSARLPGARAVFVDRLAHDCIYVLKFISKAGSNELNIRGFKHVKIGGGEPMS